MGAQQIFTRDGFTEHNLYILYDAIFSLLLLAFLVELKINSCSRSENWVENLFDAIQHDC